MLALEAHGLKKAYRTLTAIDKLSFTVRAGEVVDLLGPTVPARRPRYVVVVPDGGQVTARRLSVSRSIDVRVTGRRTLDSQGVVPLALAVPALLGLLVVAIGVRRSRA